MLLVDGSWSIGRTNFRRVRDFLEGLVIPFHIGPNHIQIGEDQIVGHVFNFRPLFMLNVAEMQTIQGVFNVAVKLTQLSFY